MLISKRKKIGQIRSLLDGRNFDQAGVYLQPILEEFPGDCELLFLAGHLEFQKGNMELARDHLSNAIKAGKQDFETTLLLGSVHLQLKQEQEALEWAEKAIGYEKAPENSAQRLSAYQLGASAAGRLGLSGKQCDLWQAAADIWPDDPVVLTNFGAALNKSDRPTDALEVLRRADQHRPGHAITLNNLSSAERRLGRAQEAVNHLKAASRAAPSHGDIRANLARALAENGNYDEAVKAYREALKLDPQSLETHRDLSHLLWQIGRFDELTASFDLADASSVLLAEKGDLLREAEKNASAYEAYQAALALDPTHKSALIGRAMVAPEKRQETCWMEAAAKLSTDPDLRLEFGSWLMGQSRWKEAEMVLGFQPPPDYRVQWLALQRTLTQLAPHLEAVPLEQTGAVVVGEIDVPPRYADLQTYLAVLKGRIEAKLTLKHEPLSQSLMGGIQSQGELFDTEDPVLLEFRQILEATAKRLIDSSPFYAKTVGHSLGLLGAWAVSLRNGGGHHDHFHPGGSISSACYISVPDGLEGGEAGGTIRFGRPKIKGIDVEPELRVAPRAGRLVVFPSWLWHGVDTFTSNERRVTVAADFKLA